MRRYNYSHPYIQQQYITKDEDRLIGPILPFIGGALVGYISGRPQYNYTYPAYYPIYYPYYYQQPYYYNNHRTMNN